MKDIDLIPMFELIVDLHYDKDLPLILKMMVQKLLYKAKKSKTKSIIHFVFEIYMKIN